MSAAIKTKTSASIRIDTDLLNTLKSNAKKDNRSFSNYMETILFDVVAQQQPRDITEGICQGLREVKMIKDGKLKSKSADELFDEL
jgi:predicted transcriptional regulator